MKKKLGITIGSVLLAGFASTSVQAGESPFAMQALSNGYQLAEADADSKAAEGKCGDKGSKAAEGKCGDKKEMGEAKAAEGKCGDKKATPDAAAPAASTPDSKTAEGKCGDKKMGADMAAPTDAAPVTKVKKSHKKKHHKTRK